MPRMPVQELDNLDDPRLAPFRELPERELARGSDLFIAEGEMLVRRLLGSSLETVSVVCARKRLSKIESAVPDDVPFYMVPDELIHEIVGFHFHSGLIACGRRPAPPSLESLARDACTLAVCPKIINVANVGSMLRVCAALGATGLILGEESCDPFMRQAVRVSMGAAFTMPILKSENLHTDLRRLRDEFDVELVGAVADASADPLPAARRRARTALLFGPEDRGLDRQTLELCTSCVTIPMGQNVDSLNVAVAAAVVIYHYRCVAVAE